MFHCVFECTADTLDSSQCMRKLLGDHKLRYLYLQIECKLIFGVLFLLFIGGDLEVFDILYNNPALKRDPFYQQKKLKGFEIRLESVLWKDVPEKSDLRFCL